MPKPHTDHRLMLAEQARGQTGDTLTNETRVKQREVMGGRHSLVASLGNDWLGYIVTPEQYDNPSYIYFRALSASSQLGPIVLETASTLFTEEL